MKILLFALNSSYVHTNLAVRCIKNAIEASAPDAEVSICEHTTKDRRDAVLHELYSAHADIYGFSAYIWNITELLDFASSLKKLIPECEIIFGGPEVSFEDESWLDLHPFVSRIITGEGETPWTDIALGKIDGRRIIRGCAYDGFEHAGALYDNAPQGTIVYYESSRGCPYSCAFCLSGREKGLRFKDVDTVFSDLQDLAKLSRNIKIVKFVDRTFNADRRRAREIWRRLIQTDYPLSCHFEICASLLEEEDLEILSSFKPGRIQLEIGVQSTNEETLKAVNRVGDTQKIISTAARIKAMGSIHVHCDLIAGLPHESYRRFGQSFDEVYGSCDMLQLGYLKLLRGSALREKADEYGLVFEDTPPYTILSTPDLSYDELYTLRSVAALVDRFDGGTFRYTMRYIASCEKSMFGFYENLHLALGGRYIQSLGQAEARLLLFNTAKEHDCIDTPTLIDCLRLDFYLSEIIPLPFYLAEAEKKERQPELPLTHSIPGHRIEAHSFVFAPNNTYIIDRTEKSIIKINK